MHLFTYGTLMLPEVMEIVIGALPASEPARLVGFRRAALRGAIYPGLVPAAGRETQGVLWRDLDAGQLGRIDRFEGALYEREQVAVECRGAAAREAAVYVIGAAHRHRVEAAPWSEADFRARHLAAYLRDCRAFARGGS